MQMMHTKYFVSHDGKNLGPFEAQAISDKISSGELTNSDYIYLDATSEWIPISQHSDFKHEEDKENNENKSGPSLKPDSHQWYVLKGKNRYGPFIFLDLIRMLQEKSLFEFDYIWHDGLETWKRLAEVEDFHPTKIKALLKEEDVENSQLFHRRRHLRFKYECPLVAHDNAQVWRGKTVELSEGGAGIVMDNAMILPGQNVYVHFKPGPTSKPFNVLCEIVSKKYSSSIKDRSSSVVYGVKFINIHKQDSEEIKTLKVAA
jgi:hypothetical protein